MDCVIARKSYGGHPVAGTSIDDHHHAMDREAAKLIARLELDARADTVDGTITGDDGIERRFSGWMELANAIEAWRTAHTPRAGVGRDAMRTTPRGPPPR
jgi:L-arabinose isomerase